MFFRKPGRFNCTTLPYIQEDRTVAANAVTSSPILVTLMIEAQSSSETSVLTGVTQRIISVDALFIVTAVKASNLTGLFIATIITVSASPSYPKLERLYRVN
jgi:hypothetical protein